MKKTVIDKATTDKPAFLPLDPDQRAVLIVLHGPSMMRIRSRGWTLNEVLARTGWKLNDILATFKKPWKKDRGAVKLSEAPDLEGVIDKLNQKGGEE